MGHLLGYARVSTTEYAGCYRVFVETASGARADRPVLKQFLDRLRPGDTPPTCPIAAASSLVTP